MTDWTLKAARERDAQTKYGSNLLYGQLLVTCSDDRRHLLALVDTLAGALRHSVTVIRDWHNMGGSDDVWPIYESSAPEMKPIRAALAELDKE